MFSVTSIQCEHTQQPTKKEKKRKISERNCIKMEQFKIGKIMYMCEASHVLSRIFWHTRD